MASADVWRWFWLWLRFGPKYLQPSESTFHMPSRAPRRRIDPELAVTPCMYHASASKNPAVDRGAPSTSRHLTWYPTNFTPFENCCRQFWPLTREWENYPIWWPRRFLLTILSSRVTPTYSWLALVAAYSIRAMYLYKIAGSSSVLVTGHLYE